MKKLLCALLIIAILIASPQFVQAAPLRETYIFEWPFDVLSPAWNYGPFASPPYPTGCVWGHGNLSDTYYGDAAPGFAATSIPRVCFEVPVNGTDLYWVKVRFHAGRTGAGNELMVGAFVRFTNDTYASWAYNVVVNPSDVQVLAELIDGSDIEAVGAFTYPSNNYVNSDYAYLDDLEIELSSITPNEDPFGEADNLFFKPAQEEQTREINYIENLDDLITTDEDASVYAVFDGTVTYVSASTDGYRVTITASDDSYAVYNNLSTIYPKQGDTITAGCVIGLAGQQIANTTETYTDGISQFWFVVRDSGDVELDWSDWVDPFGDEPCGEASGNCVNLNPTMDRSAAGWKQYDSPLREDSITVQDDAITLDWDDSIYQTVVLSTTSDWYVTIVAAQVNSTSAQSYVRNVEVTLGDDVIDQAYGPVRVSEEVVIEVGPLSPTTPDYPPDMYDLRVRNNHPASDGMQITFVCLHQVDAIEITPSYCYFNNYTLENAGDGWNYDAGADWRQNGLSLTDYHVWLDAGEWISQAVSLTSYDTEDAVYQLTIAARVGGNDLTDLVDIFVSGWETTAAQEVYDGAVLQLDIGDVTLNNVVIYQSQVTEFTVTTAESPLEGDLIITADDANTKALDIDYVCIEPLTGLWPGEEDDDLTLVIPTCESCSSPESINIIEWLGYMVCISYHFWYCNLAQWINDLGATIYSITSGLGYLGRWLSAALFGFGVYLLDLASALGQLVLDIMAGVLATVWNWIASLPILALIYDAVSLVWYILTSGGELLALLASLMTNVLGAFVTFANIVAGFKDALFAAINSTSVVETAMPTCANPEDPLYGLCIGLQLVEDVLTEFPTTAASLYVVAGVVGIITIIWTVKQLGQAAGDVK